MGFANDVYSLYYYSQSSRFDFCVLLPRSHTHFYAMLYIFQAFHVSMTLDALRLFAMIFTPVASPYL